MFYIEWIAIWTEDVCDYGMILISGYNLIIMQNTPFYVSKDFIAEIKGEEII